MTSTTRRFAGLDIFRLGCRWNYDDAVLDFPSDRGGVFWRVFDEVRGVGVCPVGGHDFDVDDDAVRDVRRDDGDGAFSHNYSNVSM